MVCQEQILVTSMEVCYNFCGCNMQYVCDIGDCRVFGKNSIFC